MAEAAAVGGATCETEIDEPGRRPAVRRPQGLTYYHELDETLVSATSATFIGQLYSLLGLVNIADGSDPDGFGYPQLSAEVDHRRGPRLHLSGRHGLLRPDPGDRRRPARMGDPPGGGRRAVWSNWMTAVASRWGPRVVDLLETVAGAVAGVPVG